MIAPSPNTITPEAQAHAFPNSFYKAVADEVIDWGAPQIYVGMSHQLEPDLLDIPSGYRVVDGMVHYMPLDQLADAYTAIHQKVLVNEGGLIPRLTLPPHPESGVFGAKANTDAWLRGIVDGTWPLMVYEVNSTPGESEYTRMMLGRVGLSRLYQPKSGRTLEPYRHDFTGNHMRVSGLLPREISSRLRRIAAIGLDWRTGNNPKILLLPGELSDDEDKLGYAEGYTPQRYQISSPGLIDAVTDDGSYTQILSLLVDSHAPSELLRKSVELNKQEQENENAMNEMVAFTPFEDRKHTRIDLRGIWESDPDFKVMRDCSFYINKLNAAGMALQNFITRHTEQRNMNDDEQGVVKDEVMSGVLRVALKTRGDIPADS